MIRSRNDLTEYILADQMAYFRSKPTLRQRLTDDIWQYQHTLRKCEYLLNTNNLPYLYYKMKLIGNIEISDNAVIGANAVVNRSFPDGGTIGGIPAKVISTKDSNGIIKF